MKPTRADGDLGDHQQHAGMVSRIDEPEATEGDDVLAQACLNRSRDRFSVGITPRSSIMMMGIVMNVIRLQARPMSRSTIWPMIPWRSIWLMIASLSPRRSSTAAAGASRRSRSPRGLHRAVLAVVGDMWRRQRSPARK